MRRFCLLVFLVSLTAACGDKAVRLQNAESFAPAEAAAPAPMMARAADMSEQKQRDDTLAYEHYLQVEIAKELLAARVDAVRAACVADRQSGCSLLEIASHEINGVPQGNVRVRIAPGGVDTLVKLAGDGGRVTSSRTSAEDLAQPLADTERQLALLNLHRQRLTEFMSRKDMKVADLITVSRELATVQTQIDEFGSQHANLRRRVDTELLTINWSPPVGSFESAQTPVVDALKSFGSNFKEAVAQIITFLAFVLPWLVLAIPGLLLIRLVWRRLSEWRARRRAVA